MLTDMNESLQTILTKMCEVVGTDPTVIDFKEKDWFLKHTWTEEQEENFKKWFVNFLKTNSKARQQLLEHPNATKKILEKAATEFVFNYGWKYEKVPTLINN